MRHMVYKAAWEFDHGCHERLTVALMKRYVPRAATEVASDAMQILGGRGYTTHERISSIWQDCRGFQIAEGTDQIMVYIGRSAHYGKIRFRHRRLAVCGIHMFSSKERAFARSLFV